MIRVSILLTLLSLTATTLTAQCGQGGVTGVPQISVTGDTLGDTAHLNVTNAPPGAPWVWLADVAAGPTTFAFGTLCTGAAPFILVDAVSGPGPAIGPSGSVSVPFFLPTTIPGLAGFPFAMQAAVVDPTAPSFLALSPGITYSVRSPHLYQLAQGQSNPFGGSTPGSLGALNVLTDQVDFSVPLPGQASAFCRASAAHRIYVLMGDGSVRGFDEFTGAAVANFSPASPFTNPAKILSVFDGTALLILYTGTAPNPFIPGTPGGVVLLDAIGGFPLNTLALASGNPTDMLLIPGTTTAYLRSGTDVIPCDYTLTAAGPAISLGAGFGSVTDWILGGSEILVLAGGTLPNPFGGTGTPGAINVIDTTTNTLLYPASTPLPGTGGYTALRYGAGPGGPAFYALNATSGALQVIAPGTLTIAGSVALGAGTNMFEASAGGAEWLVGKSGTAGSPFGGAVAGTLRRMDPTTFSLTTIGALPAATQSRIFVLASETVRKAYVPSSTGVITPLTTDPTTTVGAATPAAVTNATQGLIE